MKKYNLAKRKGGISKGSLRPRKRAQREGMDRLRRQGTRILGKTEITSGVLHSHVFVCMYVCACLCLRVSRDTVSDVHYAALPRRLN